MSGRQHERALAPVGVRELDALDAEPMSARDIGAGGLFILTDQRWEKGTELELVITYGAAEIPIVGRVLRHEEDGVAFAFDKPGAKVRNEIRDLLAALFARGIATDERRRRSRKEVSPYDIMWMTGDGEQHGTLAEVSLDGARVTSFNRPAVDALHYVFLPLKSGGRIDDVRGSEAMVVRHTKDGFAVKFVNAGVSFHEAIAMLVDE